METSQLTFSNLIKRLDYETSASFISTETPMDSIPTGLDMMWSKARIELQIDAVYFIANAPIIYFKKFESFSREDIADFHLSVWNQSQAPLIFVIMPNDIRVYCGYEAPNRFREGKELKEPTRLENQLSENVQGPSSQIWDRLRIFNRVALESGKFWRDYSEFFRKETRVDQMLIANLRYVRRELIKIKNLQPEYAHSLIGRSIFALYLQDRGVLSTENSNFFSERYNNPNYDRYTDLLISYDNTYEFFDFLHKRFNGDMFPVTDEERKEVTPEHLLTLRKLFTEDKQSGGQLLFFWAYDFKFIPIEFISSIYEEFLYQEESGKNGAYYTPPMLVDFMLNSVMPWGDLNYECRVLDPSCGSGVFLVEAYRRLIERWRVVNGSKISFEDLTSLLTNYIYGIDIKRQALRVAAFSLYLAMLDYLEPKSIWREVHFPALLGKNLIESDFFNNQIRIRNVKFDLVVGNPPWESKLTQSTRDYLAEKKLDVGDKQIVQAFLWHASDFCNAHGQIALLCSSKSILFNKSAPNVAFRKRFFSRFSVKSVFDFSAIRRSLFENGLGPAAAIFYTPQESSLKARIFYGAPKPTYFSRLLSSIIVEASDLKQLSLRQVLDSIASMESAQHHTSEDDFKQQELFLEEDDEVAESKGINIWKVALWGTDYDYTLLQSLKNYPSLDDIIQKRSWYSKVGFNRSGPGRRKHYEWLDNADFMDTKDITRYGINANLLKKLPEGDLYYRGGNARAFKAPLVLFKRGQMQRRPCAAYTDLDCTYTESITGIAGPERDSQMLKVLTALLNSELAQYYLFLTSASWGVEREEIKAGEVRALPFPFLDVDGEKVENITALVDLLAILNVEKSGLEQQIKIAKNVFRSDEDLRVQEIDKEMEEVEDQLNMLIYDCFELDDQEIQSIKETVKFTIGFFNSPEKSLAQQRVTTDVSTSYSKAYLDAINFYLEPIGRKMVATIFDGHSHPLLATQFYIVNLEEDVPKTQINLSDDTLRQVLSQMYVLSTEHIGERIYHRRNFRIYDKIGNTLLIIKPAEQRQWTIGEAVSDAEETVFEMFRSTQQVTRV